MDAEFWVLVGFVLFLALAGYYGVQAQVGRTLDARGDRIRSELDQAKRLRAEAEEVLASFERKRKDAERDAAQIVEQARAEADMIATDAQRRLDDFVRRRQMQAEAKIATAETRAMADVRAAAADAATAAAAIVLKAEAKGPFGDRLVVQGVDDVKRLVH